MLLFIFLTGFGYFGVNYVIEEIQNVLVGNINVDHDLLVIEFVEREEGTLTLKNRIEIHDEKHKLTYTYNARVEDFVNLNEPRLIVYTDSEQVNIVTYSSVILTTTFQAIDVDIELNLDYEFSPGEQLSFTLTFTIENTFPSEVNSNEEEIVISSLEPVVYDMVFDRIANNQTLTEGNLTLTNVNLMGGYLELTSALNSTVDVLVNKGTVKLELGFGSLQSRLEILVNGVFVDDFRTFNEGTIDIIIEEDNTILRVRVISGSTRGFVRQITYTPE